MNRDERLNQERNAAEKKRKVAAYCRVSTDGEDQTNSFESQKRYFRQYIERNPDWELYEIFADEGISGTNTKKRRAFNRMIACAKNGDFDLILTKEISRFARNTLDSIYYTRDLKQHGVGVIFLNDNINTMDGDAELRLAILSSIAQEESRKTSERVKWGQKRRMEQGVVFGRDLLGYDVRGGKLYINEEGAKIVRLIFHKFVAEGKGAHTIARELREEGIPPCRGGEWQHTVILRMIRNEKYCGDLVQKKTYTPDFLSHEKKYNRGQEELIIIRDHHEPIISRELFDEANRILDERSRMAAGKARYGHPPASEVENGLSCTSVEKSTYDHPPAPEGETRLSCTSVEKSIYYHPPAPEGETGLSCTSVEKSRYGHPPASEVENGLSCTSVEKSTYCHPPASEIGAGLSCTSAEKSSYCHPPAANVETGLLRTSAGMTRYSTRYPFSGKIRCGQCGRSYAARYKTRRDGSRYKAWRCLEAVRNGPPHPVPAGGSVGCAASGIRNEDAVHLICLVTKTLRFNRTKLKDSLLSVIQSVITADVAGTDIEKRRVQLKAIENKRARLIDLYLDGNVTKEEFTAASAKYDCEIAGLQPASGSIEQQQAQMPQKQELIRAIGDAVSEILNGVEYEDTFYRQILNKIVVNDRDHIDVYLNLLPFKWSYTAAENTNGPREEPSETRRHPKRSISGASVPTSVSTALPMS